MAMYSAWVSVPTVRCLRASSMNRGQVQSTCFHTLSVRLVPMLNRMLCSSYNGSVVSGTSTPASSSSVLAQRSASCSVR